MRFIDHQRKKKHTSYSIRHRAKKAYRDFY